MPAHIDAEPRRDHYVPTLGSGPVKYDLSYSQINGGYSLRRTGQPLIPCPKFGDFIVAYLTHLRTHPNVETQTEVRDLSSSEQRALEIIANEHNKRIALQTGLNPQVPQF